MSVATAHSHRYAAKRPPTSPGRPSGSDSSQAFALRRQDAYRAVTESDWVRAGRLFGALADDSRIEIADLVALATIRLRLGDFEGTWQVAQRVLERDEANVKAAHLATLALTAQNRWADALPLFERHPSGPAREHYHFVANHGVALASLGRPEEALSVLLEAMALNLNDPAVHMKLAIVLRDLKMFEESAESFLTALTLDPKRLAAQLMVLHMRQYACQWSGFEQARSELVRALADDSDQAGSLREGGVFALVAIDHPPKLFLRATAGVAMHFPQIQTPLARRRIELRPGRRFRVGYVSNDFYNHATSALFVESLERRDTSRFEVTLYSHSQLDGSHLQRRVQAACDHFVDISVCSDEEAARRIHADQIDLLVDLKGHTLGNRLGIFAWRPAPLQVSFLGFPGTSGADYIDYVIGDRWVTPLEHADRYSEKIAQMPGCYQPNDSTRGRPMPVSRLDCGLPEDGIVLGCFNQAFKITPEAFDVWMRILKAIPDSVLWLLEDNLQATTNLRREAAARGVHPGRLIFAPRLPNTQNLARLPLADLMLDNWPCNAHTTASDMLWMGVPLLTVQGESFAARVASSLLNAVGLPELVCSDAAEYEAAALSLLRDPGRLRALRERLSERLTHQPLFDGAAHACALEALFLRMLDRAANGLPPTALPAQDMPSSTTGAAAAQLARPRPPSNSCFTSSIDLEPGRKIVRSPVNGLAAAPQIMKTDSQLEYLP